MIYKARQRRRFWQRPAPETLRGAIQTETDSNVPLLYLEQLPNLTHGLTPARLRHILADADGSRLWDKETLEKMDKDRFRQSLGGLIEAYEAVARRLGVQLD